MLVRHDIGPRAPVSFSVSRPRILLADDHTMFREALAKMLEPSCEVVGAVGDGLALLELAPKLRPDAILLDLSMPIMNGTEAGEKVKAILPNTRIIILTVSENVTFVIEPLRTWASGFLLKKSAADELTVAIREVLRGNKYVTPLMREKMEATFAVDPLNGASKTLTSRQRQVLQVLAAGHTMKEAAEILHISARTVAFHKYRIMGDLCLKNYSDLVQLAIKEHLISSPQDHLPDHRRL
jgi:DNA-binding NarL/FixJ family response regulator